MRTTNIAILVAACLLSSVHADPFTIERIQREKQYAYVENSWTPSAPCIAVRFNVEKDTESKALLLRAYFFDSKGEMIHKLNAPSTVSDAKRQTSAIPVRLEPRKDYTVYFAIPKHIEKGAGGWHRTIIVLGNREEVTATAFPTDDIQKFEFPEKNLLH